MAFDTALAGKSHDDVARDWLQRFQAALDARDADALVGLFVPDGHWRDVLAFHWQIATVSGREAIRSWFGQCAQDLHPKKLRIGEGRTSPRCVVRAGVACLEVLIAFETRFGQCAGTVRLVPSEQDAAAGGAAEEGCPAQAWILTTSLEELTGHEEKINQRRPGMEAFSRDFGGENWLDKRNREMAFEDREPAVVIVGAGQAGLAVAARLKVLGVDTLVIDREQRIGDNWRTRYHSLVLHNEVHVNHLPYMPFPPNCPVYIPKDKLANWFETYADAMELNVWCETELVHGTYDEDNGVWVLEVRQKGASRVLKPRHMIFATGVSAMPVMADDVPGLEAFEGRVIHTEAYAEGHMWAGKNAVVLGTGNSGHDVAQDLHAAGAQVHMIQRSPTYIVSLKEAQKVYAIYEEGPPVADCDILAMAMPYPVMIKAYQMSTKEMAENDAALLDGLKARGFRLNLGGDDDTGFQMNYLRRGGGYYFNVGCSDLIASGDIGLVQYDDIESFVVDGLKLKTGARLPADLLVMATGYKNQQEMARVFLGDAVAEKIGPVWGFGDGGELRNMWSRTPQPGLWFTAGSLAQCRIYSRYLALQIKACEVGLIDKAAMA